MLTIGLKMSVSVVKLQQLKEHSFHSYYKKSVTVKLSLFQNLTVLVVMRIPVNVTAYSGERDRCTSTGIARLNCNACGHDEVMFFSF